MRVRAMLTFLAIPALLTGTAISAEAFPSAEVSGIAMAPMANPGVAPGGNFDLSVWQLQEPVGSPGSPTTISSSRLQGANGFQDSYF